MFIEYLLFVRPCDRPFTYFHCLMYVNLNSSNQETELEKFNNFFKITQLEMTGINLKLSVANSKGLVFFLHNVFPLCILVFLTGTLENIEINYC